MIQSDNHVHTSFSSDSDTPMEDMIAQARKIGLTSLCFTDHMDFGYPAEKYQMKFLFSAADYFSKIKELSLSCPDFPLRFGVELGLKADIISTASALTRDYPFDFVIGSTHLVDNLDPYDGEYWESYGETKGIRHYYETTLENIRLGFDFDAYGHIDYIIRYCPSIKAARAKQEINEKYYKQTLTENRELLEEILLALIRSGKALEVNTGGFAYMLGHPNPHEDILHRYHALGGELLTIGSDAHNINSLAGNFARLPALLQNCGFTHYTEFHQRQPVQIALS